MEVRKLYYEDCHLREFSARVLDCRAADGGFQIILDATAFYPEGGGQACDTGTLNGVQVTKVWEAEETVVHLCDAPLSVGAQVQGIIDYDHRFDLMQQHTGEHIVSGIIHRLFGYHNVGFHMGADMVTIDFDGPIPYEDLARIEDLANQAVWEDLDVKCWYPTPEALPQVIYRSKRALPWPVRIVEIPGYDRCACCGVHVARTGEVGMIKLFTCVKFHQGVRIEMACGRRALQYLRRIYDQNRQVCQAFSAKPLETGEAARRMNEALAQEKYRCAGLEKQVFAAIARGFSGRGNVARLAQGLTGNSLRELADAIAQVCGGTAAVFSETQDGCGMCLVDHRGDVKALGRALCDACGGRGGGKEGFFQGSVRADREAVRAFFQNRPENWEIDFPAGKC